MHTPRLAAFDSADTVNRVVALLDRFPELHSVRSNPSDATLTLSFAVRERLDRAKARILSDRVGDHVRAFLDLRGGDEAAKIGLACDRDAAVSFVHVTRDASSFSRQELELVVSLFAEQFGERLVRDGDVAQLDDDPIARDERVDVALDALRDPAQHQRLVGFREEQRVLVYFVHARKRAKARARS